MIHDQVGNLGKLLTHPHDEGGGSPGPALSVWEFDRCLLIDDQGMAPHDRRPAVTQRRAVDRPGRQ